jgi:hypothetical protein
LTWFAKPYEEKIFLKKEDLMFGGKVPDSERN